MNADQPDYLPGRGGTVRWTETLLVFFDGSLRAQCDRFQGELVEVHPDGTAERLADLVKERDFLAGERLRLAALVTAADGFRAAIEGVAASVGKDDHFGQRIAGVIGIALDEHPAQPETGGDL